MSMSMLMSTISRSSRKLALQRWTQLPESHTRGTCQMWLKNSRAILAAVRYQLTKSSCRRTYSCRNKGKIKQLKQRKVVVKAQLLCQAKKLQLSNRSLKVALKRKFQDSAWSSWPLFKNSRKMKEKTTWKTCRRLKTDVYVTKRSLMKLQSNLKNSWLYRTDNKKSCTKKPWKKRTYQLVITMTLRSFKVSPILQMWRKSKPRRVIIMIKMLLQS